MIENSLLIGNGLNRTLRNQSSSWSDLLQDFAKSRQLKSNKNIPMPLEFERLMNLHMSKKCLKNKTEAYGRAKRSIANTIKKTSIANDSTAIHHKLKLIKINNILTTNYDGLIEEAYGLNNISSICEKSRTCLLKPTNNINDVKFYHLHGLVTKPSTMCLGQVHYSKIVKILQEDLDSKKGCVRKTNSNLKILRILRNEEKSDSWGSLFFTSNIGIVGFSLYDCEIDIWWLLAKRAALYYQDYGGAKSFIKNKIVFYDVFCKSEEQEEQNQKLRKYELLKGLRVSVVKVIIDEKKDYERAYELILKELKENGISDKTKEYII